MKSSFAAALAVLWLACGASASGILVPRGGQPLQILSHVVEARIDNQVARTTVTQVFRNPSQRTLEATYVFTLPENASVSDFAIYTGGERRPAVITDLEQARRIYDQVRHRRVDPGIVEQTGPRTFRMRVFPILPGKDQRIELVYEQTLEVENGTVRYVYPLRMDGSPATEVREDFTMDVRIRSAYPLESVYSPSHRISKVEKPGEVVVGLEKSRARLDEDFLLFYKPRFDKLGFRVVAQKRPQQDGAFLILLSPGLPDETAVQGKDILLVMDTSGSMKGEKIELAREAMRFFVRSLNPSDRFNILTFSNSVRSFRSGFVGSDAETRQAALAFIDAVAAGGGTAIDEALRTAMSEAARAGGPRPQRVLFVTDGKPTVGERDARVIVKNAQTHNTGNARIFAFGVETAIDSRLLNQLAARTGGSAELVAPGEDLEVRISEFVVRYNEPVLSDLTVRVEGVQAYDLYPKSPPDLFRGGQVKIVGRYQHPGSAVIRVSGTYDGKRIELVEELELPEVAHPDSPIHRLWAREKIAFLQDEIWWRGEAPELRNEIVSLSKEAHVLSPFTALLLLETESDYRRFGLEPPKRTLEILTRARSELPQQEPVADETRPVVRDFDVEIAGEDAMFAGRAAREGRILRAKADKAAAGVRARNSTGSGADVPGRAFRYGSRHAPAESKAAPGKATPGAGGGAGGSGGVAGGGPAIGPRSGAGPATRPGAAPAPDREGAAPASPRPATENEIRGSADWLLGAKRALAPRPLALTTQVLLRAGSTHDRGPHRAAVKRALGELAGRPVPTEDLSLADLEVALALIETYRRTSSPLYRDAAARQATAAVTFLKRRGAALATESADRLALALDAVWRAFRVGLVPEEDWQSVSAVAPDRSALDPRELEPGDPGRKRRFAARVLASVIASRGAVDAPARAVLDAASSGSVAPDEDSAAFARYARRIADVTGLAAEIRIPDTPGADPVIRSLFELAR